MSDRLGLIDLGATIRRTIISCLVDRGRQPEDRMGDLARPPRPSRQIESLATSLSQAGALRTRMQGAYANLDIDRAVPGHVGSLRRAVVLAGAA
jgi:hypothetical protein